MSSLIHSVTNMIASHSRKIDQETRLRALDCVAVCLRRFVATRDPKWEERAREFGRVSQELKARIQTHDYSAEDQDRARVEELDKAWDNLTKGIL